MLSTCWGAFPSSEWIPGYYLRLGSGLSALIPPGSFEGHLPWDLCRCVVLAGGVAITHNSGVRYRLLIFDFDGTLADTFPSFLDHMRKTSEHFRLPVIDAAALEELRTLGAREIIQRLGIPAWKVPLVARYMRRLMAEDTRPLRLFPGVREMLGRLHENGYVLSIVSSNSEGNVRAILGPEHAAQIAGFACGASLFGKASRFRQVLKRNGVPACEALAIGDEIRDIDAAREVGIDFGAVAWGYTKGEALRALAPRFVFERVEEIFRAVAG